MIWGIRGISIMRLTSESIILLSVMIGVNALFLKSAALLCVGVLFLLIGAKMHLKFKSDR